MISCVDLFCGVGGLTHGLAMSGISVKAGIDIDERCEFAFQQNNRAKFLKRDVADIDGVAIQGLWGQGVTLLAGCSPCQPFSTYSLSLIHISEPTRRYAISYAVFCLKKKK